jgi:hypothetical protein
LSYFGGINLAAAIVKIFADQSVALRRVCSVNALICNIDPVRHNDNRFYDYDYRIVSWITTANDSA